MMSDTVQYVSYGTDQRFLDVRNEDPSTRMRKTKDGLLNNYQE